MTWGCLVHTIRMELSDDLFDQMQKVLVFVIIHVVVDIFVSKIALAELQNCKELFVETNFNITRNHFSY